MQNIDAATLSKVCSTIAIVAKEAGQILKERWGDKSNKIEFKGPIDLVTEMDKKSENHIMRRLNETFPTVDILTEESGFVDTYQSKNSKFSFIIDPLDGTTSYAHGHIFFSVVIAFASKEEGPLAAAIYHPLLDELFSAEKGKGAFLTTGSNDKQISVSNTEELQQSLLATGFPYNRATSADNNLIYFNAMIMKIRDIRRNGSAALDICYTACGRHDGYWEYSLCVWDMCAGMLIAQEAGGKVTDLMGQPFKMANLLHTNRSVNVLVSNTKLHNKIIEVFRACDNQS